MTICCWVEMLAYCYEICMNSQSLMTLNYNQAGTLFKMEHKRNLTNALCKGMIIRQVLIWTFDFNLIDWLKEYKSPNKDKKFQRWTYLKRSDNILKNGEGTKGLPRMISTPIENITALNSRFEIVDQLRPRIVLDKVMSHNDAKLHNKNAEAKGTATSKEKPRILCKEYIHTHTYKYKYRWIVKWEYVTHGFNENSEDRRFHKEQGLSQLISVVDGGVVLVR